MSSKRADKQLVYTNGLSNMFNFGLRQLSQNQNAVQTSLERLATGKKVNRASDDPSAIIPIENHKAEIYSLNKELDALGRHEAFLGAKEGGLSVLSDMMIELQGLVVQAANTGGSTEADQEAIRNDINGILSGIDRIASTTMFNGQQVMQEYTSAYLDDDLTNIADLVFENPEKAQEIADTALEKVSTTRGAIGTQLKEIDSRRNVIGETLINLNASLSSMEDTDYAAESAKLVRAQILEQASIAAIDISRQSANQVLDLLKTSADFIKQSNA